MIKIVSDDKIPFLKGTLEPYAEITYLPGSKITAADVADADAIITRTRTKCNAALLENSKVKFIGTATIGFDHIDYQWVEGMGIGWTNAPGCNSGSVKQYMAAAFSLLIKEKGVSLKGKTIGIVGVGNVGKKVAEVAKAFGMNVLLNDPPRQRAEGGNFVSFDEVVAKSDIITFHTPLNREGEDKTYHLFNKSLISKLKRGVVICNTCRGEVIETEALKEALQQGVVSEAIIDVWENEPSIDLQLLDNVFIATPHIAGYSLDGKANGTAMVVQALSKHFDLPLKDWFPATIPAPEQSEIRVEVLQRSVEQMLADVVLHTYPIRRDDKTLRQSVETFEDQRGSYPLRREFEAYAVINQDLPVDLTQVWTDLGFTVLQP
jgi:erythronate-4-phosphate dehydrogenase